MKKATKVLCVMIFITLTSAINHKINYTERSIYKPLIEIEIKQSFDLLIEKAKELKAIKYEN